MPIQQMFLGAGGPAPAESLGSLPVGGANWYHDSFHVTLSGSQVTQWTDQSGNGRHQSTGGGRMGNNFIQEEAAAGTRHLTKSRAFIRANTNTTGCRWNGSGWWPGSSYTLMHICARSTKAGADQSGRIWDAWGTNWLSGYHDTNEGVVYHNGWFQQTNQDSHTSFLICIDSMNSFRAYGKNVNGNTVDTGYVTTGGMTGPSSSQGVGMGSGQYSGDINSSGSESCEFDCIMAACWSSELSTSNRNTLMNWAFDKLYG